MVLTNYLEDDWDDNSLTGRTDPQKDVFYQYSTGGTGDLLKGVYRPRWETESGSPSASSGYVAATNGVVKTPSEVTVGEFTVEHRLTQSIGDDFSDAFDFIAQNSGTYYRYYKADNTGSPTPSARLDVSVGGSSTTLISWSWAHDTVFHTESVTRDSYGNFEAFEDGQSEGTVTDTQITESDMIILRMNHDFETQYDNLVVQ